MNENFWQGKNVLVTGADGFIGSHLTEKLLSLGANVSVFVNLPYPFRPRNLMHLQHQLKQVIVGDIGGQDAIKLIKQNNPDIILHLAAEAQVNFSFDHPREVMRTNVIGTINVLDAALDLNIERIVCTSSSEVYGTAQYVPIDEKHPLNPVTPYAASKAAADRYCFTYFTTYKVPVAVIRPFNTFGPRHTYDVIPFFINKALKSEPLPVYDDGSQTRDFTYVDDMVDAFLVMSSDKKAVGEFVNFGTGKETSIKNIADMIIKFSGTSSTIKFVQGRPADVKRLCCDYTKAKNLFRWKPKVPLEEGLKRNIVWARNNMK